MGLGGRRIDKWTYGWTDVQTYGQTDKFPLCSTGLCPLQGRCPASSHSNSQSCKAGQRISLTTYCPWVTCFFLGKVLKNTGNLFIRLSVCTSVRLYVRPSPSPIFRALSPFGVPTQIVWPKSKQNSPNSSKMVQIWQENLNSGLSSIILAPGF